MTRAGKSAGANVKRAFRNLWVAGTVGAYFAALSQNLPVDIKAALQAPDWGHTGPVATRYLYLLWFLAYFFLSNAGNDLNEDEIKPEELVFDVLQSLVALAAAYFLGFLLPDERYGQWGYLAANLAVATICALSLWLFERNGKGGLNRLRWIGFFVALVAGTWAAIDLALGLDQTEPQLGAAVLLSVLLCFFAKAYWPRLKT